MVDGAEDCNWVLPATAAATTGVEGVEAGELGSDAVASGGGTAGRLRMASQVGWRQEGVCGLQARNSLV